MTDPLDALDAAYLGLTADDNAWRESAGLSRVPEGPTPIIPAPDFSVGDYVATIDGIDGTLIGPPRKVLSIEPHKPAGWLVRLTTTPDERRPWWNEDRGRWCPPPRYWPEWSHHLRKVAGIVRRELAAN